MGLRRLLSYRERCKPKGRKSGGEDARCLGEPIELRGWRDLVRAQPVMDEAVGQEVAVNLVRRELFGFEQKLVRLGRAVLVVLCSGDFEAVPDLPLGGHPRDIDSRPEAGSLLVVTKFGRD